MPYLEHLNARIRRAFNSRAKRNVNTVVSRQLARFFLHFSAFLGSIYERGMEWIYSTRYINAMNATIQIFASKISHPLPSPQSRFLLLFFFSYLGNVSLASSASVPPPHAYSRDTLTNTRGYNYYINIYC